MMHAKQAEDQESLAPAASSARSHPPAKEPRIAATGTPSMKMEMAEARFSGGTMSEIIEFGGASVAALLVAMPETTGQQLHHAGGHARASAVKIDPAEQESRCCMRTP